MTTTCPKCRYVRTPEETAPDWQCPKCGVAYNKVMNEGDAPPPRRAAAPYRSRTDDGGGWIKWAAMAFVVLGLYLAFAQPWHHRKAEHRAVVADANAGQPEVVLYGTSWCPYCAKAREFLRTRGIEFTDYDVEHNAAAAKGFRQLGGGGVPLVVIGDEVLHGYRPDQMKELLGPWLK